VISVSVVAGAGVVAAGGGVMAVALPLPAQKHAFASVTVIVTVGPGITSVIAAAEDGVGFQRRVDARGMRLVTCKEIG
jgi:hypothetical protein